MSQPLNKAMFYKAVRARMGALSAGQVAGLETLLDAVEGAPLSHRAYMLATAWHETGKTMHPIREWGGYDYYMKMYDMTGARPKLAIANGNVEAGDGPRFAGRGYVQLTWRSNYRRASKALGIDLVDKPDLALDPVIAGKVMRYGMDEGWFTGKRNADYLPLSGTATATQYIAARKIINGSDKAETIEGYAQIFERALRDGGVA